MKTTFLTTLTAAALMAGSSGAHEILLMPSMADGKLKVAIESTHVFVQPEELENADNMEAMLVTSEGETALPISKGGELSLMTEADAPEGPAWVVVHRLPLIFSVTKDEFTPGGRDVNPDANSVRIYEKFTKALINADGADATFVTEPLGNMIEIVPMTNPADLGAGDMLEVQVLANGEPLNATVEATYAGYSTEEMAFVSETETTDGKAMIEISEPGYWFLRVNHDAEPAEEGIDTHNMRAILSFDVE